MKVYIVWDKEVVIIGLTIIVADDDASIRQYLHILLTREGFSVKDVELGTEVINEYHKCKPDLLLLDIMMPGMDGFEVCRKIREESNLPIIFYQLRKKITTRFQDLYQVAMTI